MAWRSEPGPLSLVLVTTNDLGQDVIVTVATFDSVRPLDVLVGERVRPNEVRVRHVGERTVGVERDSAIGRVRDDDRRERLEVLGDIIGLDPGAGTVSVVFMSV